MHRRQLYCLDEPTKVAPACIRVGSLLCHSTLRLLHCVCFIQVSGYVAARDLLQLVAREDTIFILIPV